RPPPYVLHVPRRPTLKPGMAYMATAAVSSRPRAQASRHRPRPSVSGLDLVPEFLIATATVAAAAGAHWLIVVVLRENAQLVLFTATAAALTFWRGLGPGMIASSLGTAIGSGFFIPFTGGEGHQEHLPFEALLMFGASMF